MRARLLTRLMPRGLWLITGAPTIAAIHFLVVYAGTAVWCEKVASPDIDVLRVVLIAFSLASLLLIGIVGFKAWRQRGSPAYGEHVHADDTDRSRHQFLGHVAFLLAAMSFIGVIFVSMPLTVLTSCQ